nr:integrase arm-type DNA-binding domain-containing protein [uncultured Desulfobacter sp.]
MGKLTKKQVEHAKPRAKQWKLTDGQGMYLLITKTGKYWRYDYRFLNKRKTLALGVFPDITLKQARSSHQKARDLLNDGIDPSQHKKTVKVALLESSENSFGALSQEWQARQKWTEGHRRTVISRLERDILPYLKDRPVSEITAREVLTVCRRVEERGAIESAHRIKTIISQIMRYCVAKEIVDGDPCRDLKGALTPTASKNMAAITDPQEVGGLMRAIDGYQGNEVTRAALKLAPLVFVRPGELRHAEWSEIDFDRRLWIIPPEKMKGRIKHMVPLSNQAFKIISELHPKTGGGRYLFPSIRTSERPMSDNAVLSALRRMGYSKEQMVGHGFRAMASTNLYELGWRSELVEMQLGHKDPNEVRASYNHAKYLQERIEMMQAWADYLDGLKAGISQSP